MGIPFHEERRNRYNEEVDKTAALTNMAQDYNMACKIKSDMLKNTEIDEKGLLTTIAIPKENKALFEALSINDLTVTAAFHVKHRRMMYTTKVGLK